MKRILVLFLISLFSLSGMASAKWDPTDAQMRILASALHREKDRSKVFQLFKNALDSGMNLATERSTFLMSFAQVEFNRWDETEKMPFTEWDKKLLKLLVSHGDDINRRVIYSGLNQRTALMHATESLNFELAKEMVKLGADHLISLSANSFKLENNVLTHAADVGDVEAFEYFLNLGGFLPNTPALCSAGDHALRSPGDDEERDQLESAIKAAGYDWKPCRKIIGLE